MLEKDTMDVVERGHIPSYNFRPKEEDIILVRAEGETYFSSARVVNKMPSLAIVTGLTSCQSVVPQLVWSQDHQTVFLRVTITSMRDITPVQVIVGVKDQELTVQVLEVNVSVSQAGVLYTLYQTPPLKLYGKVDPSVTRVAVLARGLTITLGKQMNLFWMQLSRQKFGWIRKGPKSALDSDSDSEPVMGGQPQA
jgi:hypothetical protein